MPLTRITDERDHQEVHVDGRCPHCGLSIFGRFTLEGTTHNQGLRCPSCRHAVLYVDNPRQRAIASCHLMLVTGGWLFALSVALALFAFGIFRWTSKEEPLVGAFVCGLAVLMMGLPIRETITQVRRLRNSWSSKLFLAYKLEATGAYIHRGSPLKVKFKKSDTQAPSHGALSFPEDERVSLRGAMTPSKDDEES